MLAPLMSSSMTAVSLFSGLAGLDRGLELAGVRVVEMCESWEPARRVLREQYPGVALAMDVRDFMPQADHAVLAGGFPCVDLSHAGTKSGILGPQSGLVEHVFRIAAVTRPAWIVLENVPNLLMLHKGAGIRHIVTRLEELGYAWAYRIVDSRFTGVPQRRPRVLLLASDKHDPAPVLLGQDAGPPEAEASAKAWGFYWTEGRRGLGLVPGALPTLKGGSTLGLPSAPAIWVPGADPGRRFVLPSVGDGEALQGLPRGWTDAALVVGEPDLRWKLIGNAVTVGVGRWLGERLAESSARGTSQPSPVQPIARDKKWPLAGWGRNGEAWASHASAWPMAEPIAPLEEIVKAEEAVPLSHRATSGFLSRLDESGMRPGDHFYADLEQHQAVTRPTLARRRARPSHESWASSPLTRKRMQAQPQKGTKPELALRRELTARGLRYRLQHRPEPDLRWRLDLVFRGAKVAVDIRGCFWHSCSQHGTTPRSNAGRWAEKLARNIERDSRIVASLEERGWVVVVVWEHHDPAERAAHIETVVRARRPAAPRASLARRRSETLDSPENCLSQLKGSAHESVNVGRTTA